nr:hypothetical protein [Calditrichia bacterium]
MKHRLLTALVFLVLCQLFTTFATAQTRYTWNNSSGFWINPSSWSPTGVPGAQDTAVVNAGSVTLTGDIAVAKLITYGVITGDNLSVSDSLIWRAGNFSGSGTTNVLPGAVLLIKDSFIKRNSRTINTHGTTIWEADAAEINAAGGTFVNHPTGTWEVRGDQVMQVPWQNGSGQFFNEGTFRKTGPGITTMGGAQGVSFHNNGVVEVLEGQLRSGDNLIATSSSGRFQISDGASLWYLGGNHTLTGTSSVSGAGTVYFTGSSVVNLAGAYSVGNTRVTGGTANFNNAASGAMASDTLILNAGRLGGSGQLAVSGYTSWSGGSIALNNGSGGGANLGGIVEIRGTANKDFTGGTVTISGDAVWRDAGNMRFDGGRLTILPGGNLDIINDQRIDRIDGGFILTNEGTLRKRDSYGVSYLTRTFGEFNNNGSVIVETGTLLVNGPGGGTGTGDIEIAPFARFYYGDGNYTLNSPGRIFGGGTFRMAFGNIYLNGGYQVSGPTRISGGSIYFNNLTPGEAATEDVFLSGGELGGSGVVD